MHVRRLLLGWTCLTLAAGHAWAQQRTVKIDPQSSQVHFTLSDPLHTVNGTFQVQQGSIVFNPADGDMHGEIAVDAASGASGNIGRDRKMTNEEMRASKFSSVTFAPRHFTGTLNPTGDSNINVTGTFVLLGKSHQITVPMQVHLDRSTCRATGTFTVPYVEWGMKDPSVFLLHVSKQVSVSLNLSGPVAP